VQKRLKSNSGVSSKIAFVVNSSPKVVRLAIDLHENLAQVQLPVRIGSHPAYPVSPDLRRKHRAKSVPPKPDSFMADLDATLVQQILDIRIRPV
jgi:hypothetical protein